MLKVLVTGGAGFIGSNIVEELLKRGHSVRVIDNFSTGRRENLAPFLKDVELIEGDVRSLDVLRSAMCAHPTSTASSSGPVDFVLHQAALPSVPRSIKDPVTTHEVNATGTLNVLIAARDCGVRRVVYASSSSVYGDSAELPKHESMTPNPLSPYACAKLAGEHYCQVFSRLYGLETVALRYFNVFGPRQDPGSQYAAVIPKFIAAIRDGRRPVIYGDGEQSRDFTPVANVVAANLAACTVPLQSLALGPSSQTKDQTTKDKMTTPPFLLCNVAAGERYTLNFLVSEICRIAGKRVEPEYAVARPGDVKHSLASVNVLRDRLGLKERVSFPEGLEHLVRTTGNEG
ncbi:MAG TPA: SDR family oxidoreductase [bacterium]|nr:SDR family oxidoreductase [bacterium]